MSLKEYYVKFVNSGLTFKDVLQMISFSQSKPLYGIKYGTNSGPSPKEGR